MKLWALILLALSITLASLDNTSHFEILLLTVACCVALLLFGMVVKDIDKNWNPKIALGVLLVCGVSLITIALAFGYNSNDKSVNSTAILISAIGMFWSCVFEELLFRHLLLRQLFKRKIGLDSSLIIAAVVFALIHFDVAISHFTSGLIFGAVYLASRSIVTTILVHFTANMMMAFFLCGSWTPICSGNALPILMGIHPSKLAYAFFQFCVVIPYLTIYYSQNRSLLKDFLLLSSNHKELTK